MPFVQAPGTVLAAAKAAENTAPGGTDWALVLSIIATVAGAVSAIAVVVGAIYWFRTRGQRRERSEREEQVSREVAEMGDRLEQLHDILGVVITEQRDRQPHPRLSFLARSEPVEHVIVVKRGLPAIDVEGIVAAERETALATLLPIAGEGPEMPGTLGSFTRHVAQMNRLFGSAAGELPVTGADHERFEARVDAYEEDLRTFIQQWVSFLEHRRLLVAFRAQLANDGGAPAEDARIRMIFPDPCRRDEPRAKPKRPPRPIFEPRRNRAYSPYLFAPRIDLPRLDLDPPNLNGPFYDDGSLVVSFTYKAIPHHDPIRTDWFIVGVPESGTFEVEWRIGAKNLVAPATGSLMLEVRHEPPNGEEIKTLPALVNLARA
jgi:hypothetical protein